VDNLEAILSVGGIDMVQRFKRNAYALSGVFAFSHLRGDPAAMLAVQRSSGHYFQRPDQDHVTVDPSRTSLLGASGSLQVRKNAGEHWLWNGGVWADSPEWELNDIGQLRAADEIVSWGGLTYRETQPGPTFRNYRVALKAFSGWNFGGIRKQTRLDLSSDAQLLNFWGVDFRAGYSLPVQSDRLTRGGPLMGLPGWGRVGVGVRNNMSSKTRWNVGAMWGNMHRGTDWFLEGRLVMEASDRLRLQLAPSLSWMTNRRQFYGALDRESERTFGRRYLFSTVERTQVSMQIRANYAFTPDLNLELYAEPFAASGRFTEFSELPEARSFDLRRYGTDGTTIREETFVADDGVERRVYEVTDGSETFTLPDRDFTTLSFRSNLVLRWELKPGSTLFVVWQRDLSELENEGDGLRPGSLLDTFGASGRNVLAVKMTYWMPL
jgi:hypothetical protein